MTDKLKEFMANHDYVFGHTPTQIEHFMTTSQQGSRPFEFWQHVLQLRALYRSLQEMDLQAEDLYHRKEDASALWPFWTRKKRLRGLARIEHEAVLLSEQRREKLQEVEVHLEIIDRKYSDLKGLPEAEILRGDKDYWTTRLAKQMALGRSAMQLGVSVGDLSAVMTLDEADQKEVLNKMVGALQLHEKVLLPGK